MFPTVSHLIKYITGIYIPLPVQTFGFFVALAFWLSYLAFKQEFIRKEKIGLIHPFIKKPGSYTRSAWYYVILALAGFAVGYKLVFCLLHCKQFVTIPVSVVFSWKGSITGGILTGLLFFLWIYIPQRGQSVNPVEEKIHPYQVTDRLLLWCASVGFVGAILFAKLENIGELFINPLKYLSTYNGLAFYGGLIFGAGIFLYKTKKMGISFLNAADIGSPGMMLAYGVGRIGCQLSGDGDWGIENVAPKPSWLSWAPDWVWSYDFPHNVIHQGKYIQGCEDAYCNVLTQPVFPTSLYESTICLTLFFLLWICRNKFKIPGLMFFVFILCNGTERFFMEFIKINPAYCLSTICLTQAQYISLVFCTIGIGGLLWLYMANKKKLRALPALKEK